MTMTKDDDYDNDVAADDDDNLDDDEHFYVETDNVMMFVAHVISASEAWIGLNDFIEEGVWRWASDRAPLLQVYFLRFYIFVIVQV